MDLEAIEPQSYTLYGVPIVYLTSYRPRNKGGMDDIASHAVWAFKDGNAQVVDAFCAIMAHLAARSGFDRPTTVVAALASKETCSDPQSPLARLAAAVAAGIRAQPGHELIYKTKTWYPFHAGFGADPETRRSMLQEHVHCKPATGKRVVVVDDVITFGTTMEVYREKIIAAGGRMVGGLAIAIVRRDKNDATPNAGLFEP